MLPGVDSPASTALDGGLTPSLRVTRRLGKATKVRKTYLISGMNPKEDFRAYNSTITGMERAILERLFYIQKDGEWTEPPVPSESLFNRRLNDFGRKLDSYAYRHHPLEHEAFALCYHGPRRARYLKAAGQLKDKSLCRKDAELKFFMKFETYDFIEKPNPSPRGINPRDDRYLCSLGAYLHPIEKKIYKNITKLFEYLVIMKGFNQQDRGKIISEHWKNIDDCVGIPLDASRFEQSVGVSALKWEHNRYTAFYKGDRFLKQILRWQLFNKGRASCVDGHLSYTIDGRRMSGDKNTALGNCLLSAGMVYSFMEELGFSTKQYRLVVDGDDAVLFVSRKNLNLILSRIKEWFEEMGFRMKVDKIAYMLEQVDFCQSRPIWMPDGYLMVREPHKALSKDSVSKKPLDSTKTFRRWISAVGQGGVSMTGGVPCCQAYYACLVRNSAGARALVGDKSLDDFFQYKVQGMKRELMDIHPRTRSSFSLAFDVSPRAQCNIEKFYDKLDLSFGCGVEVLYPSARIW